MSAAAADSVDLPAPLDTPFHLGDLQNSPTDGPIHVAIDSRVFDVSSNRGAYGPGGSYAVFAGRDASRALAKSSLELVDCNGKVDDLNEEERGTLAKWVTFFSKRYPIVGKLAT